ncbi:MAG: helix-turn-helix transcriptional regulator [Hyphomicrobiaceae bacterium]|nr:helix-turn-helix transcriptional regulator [Hyphomicrobiaceae bacterium]
MQKHSDPHDRDLALADIRKAMIEKKMTQAELADAADCHGKTIQNLLGGRSVRDQTLFDVCMVLGLDYDAIKSKWAPLAAVAAREPMDLKGEGGMVAPVYMGAYTRAAVDQYIGHYLTLRPAFFLPDVIVAYRTNIIWDPEWPSLLFEESGRPDATYAHRGRLYIPASSMYIHLVSLTKGAMRMVLVSQLDRLGTMRGLITTLNKQGAMLVPVACPIVYMRQDEFAESALGNIEPGHPQHATYRRVLDETITDGYAKVVAR